MTYFSLVTSIAVLLSVSSLTAASRLVLVPLDNRPATGQYAEMIGHIGGAEVVSPPMRFLGNFTIPGSPDAILRWLDDQPLAVGDAYVVSTDMICYGGLFESRKSTVPTAIALARLRKFLEIRKRSPLAKLYLVSTIMRLTPSATHDAASYRLALARYVELRSQGDSPELKELKAALPVGALEEYDAARKRNHEVQKAMVAMAKREPIDLLVYGQDDAASHGPHETERATLKSLAAASPRIQFCEGIDQVPSLLVSRALLDGKPAPRLRVIPSDASRFDAVSAFESQPLTQTVADQIRVSGARQVGFNDAADYTLYVNVPKRSQDKFTLWIDGMTSALDQNQPVAVADVNLTQGGSAPDPELYFVLSDRGRPMKLLSYAAWNTAGNTIGTSVAAANMRLFTKGTTLATEVAHKHFLLYRMANDFAYHTFTRPVAFGMTEGPRKDVIFGLELHEVNDYVQRDLSKFLKKLFYDNFQGRRFTVQGKEYSFVGMTDLSIGLPWPRPYEVRLDFEIRASPVD
ncbi:MAG TPA: DUF4127 family protein [Fimbriimonas sp.]|nr:DUF4127 family protein [Fimbriimonas sp.]